MLDLHQSVASLVLDHSECAPVLQRHRIDFCCRGELSLDAACAERKLDPKTVAAELERAIADRAGPARPDPRSLSTGALVSHIVSTHHAYLRAALPTIQTLSAKVARVHGDHDPKLRDVDAAVRELVAALEPHLAQEEETLFRAVTSGAPDRTLLAREFGAMREEHLAVGRILERLHGATGAYATPDWACNSYRTLFSELSQLEDDVLEHIHIENHVLAPRFAAA